MSQGGTVNQLDNSHAQVIPDCAAVPTVLWVAKTFSDSDER